MDLLLPFLTFIPFISVSSCFTVSVEMTINVEPSMVKIGKDTVSKLNTESSLVSIRCHLLL